MPKILVVEDEQMLAKIIGMKLQEEQFEVQHAYDGEEAFTILSTSETPPDLVLLDVLLPKFSGFDVLEKLRATGKPLPKIIVFSNFAQKADVERARALGAVDYIVKAAFSPAEILTKVKAILESQTENTPPQSGASAYQSFESMAEVMPMSEVLHQGDDNQS